MPSVRARRLCPDGIFLPPDFDAYRIHSNRFREVLLAHTPLVEPISLDEAFLDVGGAVRPVRLPGSDREEDPRMRSPGRSASPARSGIAPTKFVAKLASDGCKPDGLLHVPAGEVASFLEPLPVGRLWGVGEKTGELLGRLAIRTVGDLGRTPEAILERLLGEAAAAPSAQLARGIDDRAGRPVRAAEVHRSRGDVRSGPGRRGRDPARAAGAFRAGGGSSPRGRVPIEDGHAEGPARELHDAHPFADAGRIPPISAPTSIGSCPSCTGRSRDRSAGSGSWASRRAGWSPPAPSNWRSCDANAGTTWSAPSIASSAVSAPARRARRACSAEAAAG